MFTNAERIIATLPAGTPEPSIAIGLPIVKPNLVKDFAQTLSAHQASALTNRENTVRTEETSPYIMAGQYTFSWTPHYRRGSAMALRKEDLNKGKNTRITPAFMRQDMQSALFLGGNRVGEINREFKYAEAGYPDVAEGLIESIGLSPSVGIPGFGDLYLQRRESPNGTEVLASFRLLPNLPDVSRKLRSNKMLKQFGDQVRVFSLNGHWYAMQEPRLDGRPFAAPTPIDPLELGDAGIDVSLQSFPGLSVLSVGLESGIKVDLQFAHSAHLNYLNQIFTPFPVPLFASEAFIFDQGNTLISTNQLDQHWSYQQK